MATGGCVGANLALSLGLFLQSFFFQVFSFVMLVYGEQGKAEGDGRCGTVLVRARTRRPPYHLDE